MSFTGKPTNYLQTSVKNNGFFPDLSLGDFQKLYRVPAEYQQEKVEHLLRLAMLDVNGELADQEETWKAAGHTTLADVPGEMLGTVSAKVEQYQRAVFSSACAKAFEQFATITRREIGENQAKESEQTADLYLTESNRAVRYLKQIQTKITVELL